MLTRREAHIADSLTSADVFYQRVSGVGEVLGGLVDAVNEVVGADAVPRDAAAIIHATTALVLSVIKAASSNKGV